MKKIWTFQLTQTALWLGLSFAPAITLADLASNAEKAAALSARANAYQQALVPADAKTSNLLGAQRILNARSGNQNAAAVQQLRQQDTGAPILPRGNQALPTAYAAPTVIPAPAVANSQYVSIAEIRQAAVSSNADGLRPPKASAPIDVAVREEAKAIAADPLDPDALLPAELNQNNLAVKPITAPEIHKRSAWVAPKFDVAMEAAISPVPSTATTTVKAPTAGRNFAANRLLGSLPTDSIATKTPGALNGRYQPTWYSRALPSATLTAYMQGPAHQAIRGSVDQAHHANIPNAVAAGGTFPVAGRPIARGEIHNGSLKVSAPVAEKKWSSSLGSEPVPSNTGLVTNAPSSSNVSSNFFQ